MNQLITIFILVLASSNASKYLQPIHQFQQEFESKDPEREPNGGFYEDRSLQGDAGASKLTAMGGLEGWDSAPDPRMYVLTELEEPRLPTFSQPDYRVKRKGPSLSIVNPLEVLRERLLIEMARRQKAESLGKIQRNRELLSKVGKRSVEEQEEVEKQSAPSPKYNHVVTSHLKQSTNTFPVDVSDES